MQTPGANTAEVCWLDLLPDEAMCAIFSRLHPRYSKHLRLVCSNWQRLVDDNLLWKEWSQQRWDYIHPVQERAGAWKTYYRERSCLYQLLILVYNRTHIVRVSRYNTVDDILVILEAEQGVTGTLYMDMMGKSLPLGVPLGDFGIRNGTRLHLKARLNAPPAPPTLAVPAPMPVPVVPTPPAVGQETHSYGRWLGKDTLKVARIINTSARPLSGSAQLASTLQQDARGLAPRKTGIVIKGL